MIPTLPLRLRNRLAETILASLHDTSARRCLAVLADEGTPLDGWLAPGEGEHKALLRRRARSASAALATLPPCSRSASLEEALIAAAHLFDAGLGFEVHELLEEYWIRAEGEEREALQGLIQIAVGYQHLANGNLAGARALLDEGGTRLDNRRLRDLPVEPFARAARAAARDEAGAVPRFPRASG